MLNSIQTGEKRLKDFVDKRLLASSSHSSVIRTRTFFSPIKRTNLETGLRPKKQQLKSIIKLKEDRQAFGTAHSSQ